MAIFRFFIMASSAILDFQKLEMEKLEISKIQDGGGRHLENRKSAISLERFERV